MPKKATVKRVRVPIGRDKMRRPEIAAQDHSSLRKGGICVSTVSIACRRLGRLHDWSRVGPIAADAADATDAADGIFRRSAYLDHSRSGSAFATERDVDSQHPKGCLRPGRAASEALPSVYGDALQAGRQRKGPRQSYTTDRAEITCVARFQSA